MGKLAKLLFKTGDSKEFTNPRKISPTAILNLSTLFLPIFGGTVILLSDFSLLSILLILVYVVIGIFPNFFIRGSLCEKYEQVKLGCPSFEQMIKPKASTT